MPKNTVFLGSSAASKLQAKALIKALSSTTLEFLPWWEVFTPGNTLLEELDAIRGQVHGALLLFSAKGGVGTQHARRAVFRRAADAGESP